MIVAIESASTEPSIALLRPGGEPVHVDGWTATPRQTHELLPRLEAALRAAQLELRDLTGIAVGIGPGSFTGLRVAMSLAKGLAFALRRPIVGIPSLAAWLEVEPEAAGAATRAGAADAYLLVRDGDGEPRIAGPEALRAAGTLVAPTELAQAFGLAAIIPPRRAALGVAMAAARRLAVDPGGDDLERLEPRYLRAPRGLQPAGPAAEGTG